MSDASNAGGGGTISVRNRVQRLTLRAREGSTPVVSVRRVGKSEQADVLLALPAARAGVEMKSLEFVTRLALVGADGLVDGGAAVAFGTVRHPQLGEMAATEIWEALDSVDVAMIGLVAGGRSAEEVAERAAKILGGAAQESGGGGGAQEAKT